jgi:2-polyprenyl-3-methyl-5-hydroxy-6-metoxy-1,4-benzoquinol methylase
MSAYVANVDLEALGVGSGDAIIDVGCGEGRLAELMAGAGLRVTGVEPAPYLRERFEERLARFPTARVVAGTVESLPFGDGEVDAAVSTEVLEHVPDPDAAMRELRRVLRPGAILCLSVPTSFTELLFWRLHPAYAANSTHVRIFTKPELRRLIAEGGFELVRCEGRNFRPALAWIFHALMRSPSDHVGVVHGHQWVDRSLDAVWRSLDTIGLGGALDRLGNRVWPKSWYAYCRRK